MKNKDNGRWLYLLMVYITVALITLFFVGKFVATVNGEESTVNVAKVEIQPIKQLATVNGVERFLCLATTIQQIQNPTKIGPEKINANIQQMIVLTKQDIDIINGKLEKSDISETQNIPTIIVYYSSILPSGRIPIIPSMVEKIKLDFTENFRSAFKGTKYEKTHILFVPDTLRIENLP